MALPSGTKLGPYEIQSPLGAGGMGEVYRARDTRLERIVAIKVLPSHLSSDPERKPRFEREARAISSLNHPNICTLHDVGHNDGTDFLVMEYLDGETLASRLMKGALPLEQVLRHGIEVVDALDTAHRRGIVHRDLKPSNIFLTAHGEAKVLDFGLAKLDDESQPEMATRINTASLTSPGTTVGTVAYMSPEQARGEDLDSRTDLFSLGAVIYETATGKGAFPGKTSAMVFKAILDQVPAAITQLKPTLPQRLEEIVSKLLEKDPDLRYQSAADLRSDLKRLKRDSESGRLTVSAAGTVGATTSKRRWIFEGVAAIVLVALVSGATWWYSHRPATQGLLAPMTITPFTSYPGETCCPAFSPDGNQLAFLWNGGEGKGQDVYVKLIGEATPLRLTKSPGEISGLAWSPDGRRISLLRESPEKGVFTVSALGGPERRLAEVRFPSNLGLDWSPDGAWLAVVDKETAAGPSSIFIISPDTGQRRQLTDPTNPTEDSSPAFSPDGASLAFVRARSTFSGDIFVKPVAGGEPKQVTFLNGAMAGVSWTADGKQIVFSTSVSGESGKSSLWQVSAGGGKAEKLTGVGQGALRWPAISRHGNRLAFQESSQNVNIWQLRLAPPGLPIKLMPSTRVQSGPQYSPDGRKIIFVSDRTGSPQIWLCDSDGSNPVQLTFLKAGDTGTPRWSPDGHSIVFDSTTSGNEGVYLLSADGGAVRPLVVDSHFNAEASFSRDGNWVYFVSTRNGSSQVWKVAVDGGPPTQVTLHGGRTPLESPDGKFVYYTKIAFHESLSSPRSGLWRMPIAGGEENRVIAQEIYEFYWTADRAGIYFFDRATKPLTTLKLFDPATGRITVVSTLQNPPFCCNPAITVSPDGGTILYTQEDSVSHDIMVVENFH